MWTGDAVVPLRRKGEGCPHRVPPDGAALSPSERVCQTDLHFFFLFFSVLLADKEMKLYLLFLREYLLCFSLCPTLSTEQKKGVCMILEFMVPQFSLS